jgi:hypothetical protein
MDTSVGLGDMELSYTSASNIVYNNIDNNTME